ncbi:MAG: YCF48-related protein [Ignavibacteriaceae bacterium]|nr:YCF48-related protein [Ignavibacteriaceae bacterium]
MKRFVIAAIVLFLSIQNTPQTQWYFQNPIVHDQTIFGVSYTSNDAIFAVGQWGTAIKSIDGGSTWKFLNTGLHNHLNNLFFFDKNTGYACGWDGKIIFTSDGGNTWEERTSGTNRDLWGISFYDRNYGIIAGDYGKILRTTDGGITWDIQTVGDSYADYQSVCLIDDKIGFIVGANGNAIKTTDGGLSWNKITMPLKSSDFYDIKFTSDQVGFFIALGGTHYLYQTTDGGNSWIDKSSMLNGLYPRSLHFVNQNIGFIAGVKSSIGTILKTTDAGATWTETKLIYRDNFGDHFEDISFLNSSNGIAVGVRGLVYTTTDGGANWISRSKDFNTITCTAVAFYNDKVGFAFAGAYFIKTLDGGSSWIKNLLQGVGAIDVGGAKALSENIIVAIGTSIVIGDNSNSIIKSTDGGLTWANKSDVNQCKLTLNDLCFTNQNFGIAVGDDGIILVSTNGGDTWSSQQSNVTTDLIDVFMIDSSVGYIVGAKGVILKTVNGGNTWTKLNSGTTDYFDTCTFTDENHGYACHDGDIYITKDGGITWTKQITLTEGIEDILFTNAQNGIVVGSHGLIARTTDAGLTWNYEESHTDSPLYSIAYLGPSNFTVVGSYGVILNSLKGGAVTFVEKKKEYISANFELAQNYPNPFNPLTKIRYTIPISGNIKLAVYDILGREVISLFEGFKDAGSYEIEFNAAELSSSIYFYRLITNDFILTKKMVLVK